MKVLSLTAKGHIYHSHHYQKSHISKGVGASEVSDTEVKQIYTLHLLCETRLQSSHEVLLPQSVPINLVFKHDITLVLICWCLYVYVR